MKAFKLFLIFAVSLYFSGALAAQAPLYKIEKNGQSAYLLGTIHTGVNFDELPQAAKDLAQSTDSLVVEVDLEAAGPLMATAFPMAEENSLKSQLSEEEWTKFYNTLSPLLPPEKLDVLNRMDPVIANIYFVLVSFPQVAQPIDVTLSQNAKHHQKNIFFFETPQEQIEVLRKTQNISTLKKMLAMSQEELSHSSDNLIQAYVTNNGPMIQKAMESSMTNEELEILLKNRNANWMKSFDSLFANPGTEFFAVGAAHLFGNYGLIQLLSAQGYVLTPVN